MPRTAARLLSLLSLLQSRREWSGAELAAHLAVTPRTVRNDMARLRELGYAVQGIRGGGGGYRLGAAGAALPPLLLDPDEATAVAVGLRTGVGCIIGGMEETSLRALAKLEQILPSRSRLRVRNLNRYTVPLPTNHPMPIIDPTLLTQMAGLCHQRERLRFSYAASRPGAELARDSLTRHDVEPYRLTNRQHRWYLLGYDLTDNRWAVFRVDQMHPRSPTGPRFAPRDLPDRDIANYIADHIDQPISPHTAIVTLHAPAEDLIGQIAPAEGTIEPVDEHTCTLHVGAQSLKTIALAIGRLDVDFTIVTPPELRQEVSDLASRYARAVARMAPPDPTDRGEPTQEPASSCSSRKTPEMTTPGPAITGPGVADVLRHHIGRADSVFHQDIGNASLKT
jgi:predicted DNA-binding transcriptional regulator YafY